jgi:hypothetical protein
MIDSFEKLDVIVLLSRQTGRPWTARAAAIVLGIPAGLLQIALDELCANGILTHTQGEGFRLEPASLQHGQTVASLCRLYDTTRTSILNSVMATCIEVAPRRFAETTTSRRPRRR